MAGLFVFSGTVFPGCGELDYVLSDKRLYRKGVTLSLSKGDW
jgi:hypothetical protein